MDANLKQYEREIDRELRGLAGALNVGLPEALRARVRSAVLAEAKRLGAGSQRDSIIARFAGLRGIASMAAAVAMALFLSISPAGWPPVTESGGGAASDSALDEWLVAAAESSDAVSLLYESARLGVLPEAFEEDADAESLDSLESSFESLENLLGA